MSTRNRRFPHRSAARLAAITGAVALSVTGGGLVAATHAQADNGVIHGRVVPATDGVIHTQVAPDSNGTIHGNVTPAEDGVIHSRN